MTFAVWSGELIRAVSWALQHRPAEACGVFLGHRGGSARWMPIRNAASNPEHRFVFDSDDYASVIETMERTNEELWAILHSHPSGPPQPSAQDIDAHNAPEVFSIVVDLSWDGSYIPAAVSVWRMVQGNEPTHEQLVVLEGDRPETKEKNNRPATGGSSSSFLQTRETGGGAIYPRRNSEASNNHPAPVWSRADGTAAHGFGQALSAAGGSSVGKDDEDIG